MSHNYYLYCEHCKAQSERYNYACDRLVTAVKQSYPLWLLRQTKWGQDLWNLEFDGYQMPGLAAFILEHWQHGAFMVVSEYWREDNPNREPRLIVTPDVPGGYERQILPSLVDEARGVLRRLESVLFAARRQMEKPPA